MARKYNWIEEFDEFDNSIWILKSPYEEGFKFRLKQRLFNNELEWVESHDAQLRGIERPSSWLDLSEAKSEIERCWENIWKDNSDWSQKQFEESAK